MRYRPRIAFSFCLNYDLPASRRRNPILASVIKNNCDGDYKELFPHLPAVRLSSRVAMPSEEYAIGFGVVVAMSSRLAIGRTFNQSNSIEFVLGRSRRTIKISSINLHPPVSSIYFHVRANFFLDSTNSIEFPSELSRSNPRKENSLSLYVCSIWLRLLLHLLFGNR